MSKLFAMIVHESMIHEVLSKLGLLNIVARAWSVVIMDDIVIGIF